MNNSVRREGADVITMVNVAGPGSAVAASADLTPPLCSPHTVIKSIRARRIFTTAESA